MDGFAGRAKRREKQRKSVLGAPARLWNARQRWIAAGRPVRSDEEVARIYRECCQVCPHFLKITQNQGACKLCSCSLNLGHRLNKIRWATETCPDDPPRWNAEVKVSPPPEKAKDNLTREERLRRHKQAILARRQERRNARNGNPS